GRPAAARAGAASAGRRRKRPGRHNGDARSLSGKRTSAGHTFAHPGAPSLNTPLAILHPLSAKGTDRMAQKPNSVVHVEIHSNAPEKTKAFLKYVFDWKFQDVPEMNYSMLEPPSAPGGGLQRAE